MDWESQINTFQCTDNLKGMKQLPDECVDELATDPPYGYSFMGKDWDKAVPKVEVWKECLRVMKPGAFGFILCAPRQDCLSRMIVNLEDAGFWVNFSSIYWAYASGFPKAQNIRKAVDKQNGRNEDLRKQLAKYLRENINKSGKTLKEIRILLRHKMKGGGLIPHWITENSQPTVPTKIDWIKLQKFLDLDNTWDWFIDREEAQREVIGKQEKWGNMDSFVDGGGYKSGEGIYSEKEIDITAPATPQAKALDGSYAGFQPKPAVEVVLVVMKPLSEATFVDQALKNGKGVTWLDEGRIPSEPISTHHFEGNHAFDKGRGIKGYEQHRGRFPANLLMQDDVLNDGKARKGKWGKSKDKNFDSYFYDDGGRSERCNKFIGDSGSFSRYFDLDRWFAERIKQLPESVRKTFPFLIVPKASKAEKNWGCEELPTKIGGGMKGTEDQTLLTGSGNIRNNKMKNFHPTVKPLKLMCYLITLGSRAGDVVLDPYMGSWTTAVACKMLNRNFLGYDDKTEYCEIGKGRIGTVENKLCLQENLI